MLIKSLNELDKPIDEYEVRSNSNLGRIEKEFTIRQSNADEYMTIHSDYKSTTKYIIDKLVKGLGELKYLYIKDNKIISITAKLDKGLVNLKKNPRKGKGIGRITPNS